MKKTRLISRPAKVFCVLFVVIMLFSMMTMANAAGNITDHRVTSTGYYGTNGYETPRRAKLDDTSCYVYNDSSSCGVTVNVLGYAMAVGGGGLMCGDYTGGSPSGRAYPSVPLGTWRYITNYVNESGLSYAALQLFTADEFATINLLWSPDSI